MGCGVSNENRNVYSVSVGQYGPGETEVRRHPKCVDNLTEQPDPLTNTLCDVLVNITNRFPNRPYLGVQVNDVYQFQTYQEIMTKADQLGSGIKTLKLAPTLNEYQNITLRLVGIFAKNRPEWVILDWANILHGQTMVPFYDTLGAESIPFILEQTNLTTMFCAAQPVKTLLQLKPNQLGKLTTLVMLDELPQEDAKKVEDLGLKILSFQQVIQAGSQSIVEKTPPKPEDIFTFSYTSGTTGNPKGALMSHKNFVAMLSTTQYSSFRFDENDVHLSYLPLPHVMERIAYLTVTYNGGSVGFYRGDPLQLKDDIARLRPTFFVSVPRLFNKFYDGIKAKIEAVEGAKRSFAERAIRVKLENLRSSAQYTHFLYDKAFEGVRQLFGGRVRFMLTGSAPISREVIDFLKIAGCCPIYEGYGQTESTGGSFMTMSWDPQSGHVGGPTSTTEFKLQDVAEMNYTAADLDINGRSQPRGEICIRGPSVFVGYYKDPEKTREAIDEQGWLHTGDIGMILPGGSVRIIDRKKNIFKLSQGEYIAPEKIENIYLRAKGVAEAFVYGDSLQNNCVAIIVPAKDYIENYGKQNGISGSFEELCQNSVVVKHMLDNLTAQGKADKLNSLENVKAVYLEPVSFQLQGCMTTTFKLQRHQAKMKFQAQIDQMYQQIK